MLCVLSAPSPVTFIDIGQIYLVILTVRILLSWFRTIDWYAEPWNTLRQVRAGSWCAPGANRKPSKFFNRSCCIDTVWVVLQAFDKFCV